MADKEQEGGQPLPNRKKETPISLRAVQLEFIEPLGQAEAQAAAPGSSQLKPAKEESKQADLALAKQVQAMQQMLEHIQATLQQLVEVRAVKDWYCTAELAQLLSRAEFTVREWCRQRRIHAEKRPCGRGRSQEWIVSHAELERIRNEGLLPQDTVSTRIR